MQTRRSSKRAAGAGAADTAARRDAGGGGRSPVAAEGDEKAVKINRAPVLTMWVAVVAQREGYEFEEGLSFGKAVAGILAHSKGRSLGVYEDADDEEKGKRKRRRKEVERFSVFGMKLPGKRVPPAGQGLRLALQPSSDQPISPPSVLAYLRKSFGPSYDAVKDTMSLLARSYEAQEIGAVAYSLYEKFRPSVSHGIKGWGAKGNLDLEHLQSLCKK